MMRALIPLVVACAPKSPPASPVPAEVLPEEGSVCESERGVPISEIQAPMYRVYTPQELRDGFPVGARFRFHQSPMDAPSPRPAVVEEWLVVESDATGLTVHRTVQPDGPQPSAEPEIWTQTWEEWGGRWTFPVAEVTVEESSCPTIHGESVAGVQIRQSMPSAGLDRVFEYCFATEAAMPPITQAVYDHGTLSGTTEMSAHCCSVTD